MRLVGAGGVKNFSKGICDGAPSTARSSLNFCWAWSLKKNYDCGYYLNIHLLDDKVEASIMLRISHAKYLNIYDYHFEGL